MRVGEYLGDPGIPRIPPGSRQNSEKKGPIQKVSRVERSQFHIKEKKCNFFVASVVRIFIMVARCSKCDFRNLGIIWDRNR